MQNSRRPAGLALLIFTLGTFGAFTMINAPAGNYDVGKIDTYLAASSRVPIIAGGILGLVAAAALLVYLGALRAEMPPGRARDVVWGGGIVAAATASVGWTIAAGIPVAYAEGGGNVSLTPSAAYTGSVIAALMVYGPALLFTGIALIVAARKVATASRLWRVLTYVGGVSAILSLGFFPYYLFVLYGVVAGVWGIASGGRLVGATREPIGANAS